MTITPGEVIVTDRLGAVRVQRLLGEGGQGRVYEVVAPDGSGMALKWYKPAAAVREQWQALEYLLERGAPDRRFLWPTALAGSPGSGSFGYLMGLRPPDYVSMSHLASGVGPAGERLVVGFAAVVELCRQVAETFLRLHGQGLCYRDISLANVFFAPARGDVLVCDVDNVSVDDGTARVRGTGRFMAPEIVADPTGRTAPSTLTDRHSLAVLLFLALLAEHPLEGKKTDSGLRDEAHLLEHFGRDPVFSLHPGDDRNPPVAAHVQRYWNDVYPAFLRRLFVQAFTDGLADPRRRVGEGQWVRALGKLRDVMGLCPGCGATVFHDPENAERACWSCTVPLGAPLTVVHGRRRVVVGPHVELSVVLAPNGPPEPLARGVRNAHDPTCIGLHNVSGSSWRARYADGFEQDVGPGQALELKEGLAIATCHGAVSVVREPLPVTG